ncbi:hypothetical protein AZH11_05845 [Pseudomonas simiae]|nr:hypothetical protein AZH11_05845 [Pseudomonas simiae]
MFYEVSPAYSYSRYAHHPTAIATTLDGLPESVNDADQVVWYAPANLGWGLPAIAALCTVPSTVCDSIEGIIEHVKHQAKPGTQVVVMSNGGFGGLHGKLAEALK